EPCCRSSDRRNWAGDMSSSCPNCLDREFSFTALREPAGLLDQREHRILAIADPTAADRREPSTLQQQLDRGKVIHPQMSIPAELISDPGDQTSRRLSGSQQARLDQ